MGRLEKKTAVQKGGAQSDLHDEGEGDEISAKGGRPIAANMAGGGKASDRRLVSYAIFAVLLCLAYSKVLFGLVAHAASIDLHSHILLIPLVTGYLIYTERDRLPRQFGRSLGWATASAVLGAIAFALTFSVTGLSHNDSLALSTFSFLCFLVGGAFLFLGKQFMGAVAFPVAFLIFMVPIPDTGILWLETGLMRASADASEILFRLSGTPYLRDGQHFQLPGFSLEVAQECSGIRSSVVLFITSILASYLFLKRPWKRFLLVAVVIPLGIVRNGFRVMVIGLLCVHRGPHMIDHVIHKKGGPFFFALSLIPLFLLLWILHRSEADDPSPATEKG